MLTIRNTQLQALGQRARGQFISDMQSHLYTYFPAEAWLLTPDELRDKVNTTIDRAAIYQLTSPQQVCRFINLAATYGWEFDCDPDLLWMRGILADTSLSQPGERLDRLVQTCLHRQSIEEHNRALHRKPSLAPVIASSAPAPHMPEDYSGLKHDVNTGHTAAGTEEMVARNPLSYHVSQSLWYGPEAMPAVARRSPAPAWVNDTSVLLRQKPGRHHVLGN